MVRVIAARRNLSARRTEHRGCPAQSGTALGTAALLTGLLLAACGGSSPKPQGTLSAYLEAWSHQNWSAMAALVEAPPADFANQHVAINQQLAVTGETFQPGVITSKGSQATAPLTSHLNLAAYGKLDLASTITLQRVHGQWLVAWSPATVATQLRAGDRFVVAQTWLTRAPILGAGGVSLTPDVTNVTIGLQGSAIKDPTGLQTALVTAGLDPAKVSAAVNAAAAHPNDFEAITTLPDAAYQQIQAAIHPLPGTRFHTRTAPGPRSADLGAHVVGTVGPITAEELTKLGAPYRATDSVGQQGLEQLSERQLAGIPAFSVKILAPDGSTVATLASTSGTPGQPVQTSIDPWVQAAAEAALNGVAGQAAMVVMRASTGEVLASVSRPTSQAFDLAFSGELPPGSTMKVITAAALLQSGLAASATVTCPTTVSVGGRTFHNFEMESQSTLTLAQAFAASCNTAFVPLASHLPPSALPTTATSFGIGADIAMGLPAFGGKVPLPADAVEQAATAIGQGRVVASPLVMADVAAAVDAGAVHRPRLVAGAPDDTAAAQPLDPGVLAQLRPMMAAVVTTGTASGAGLPAGTFAKTGTAEFGSSVPPATHAWFIGYRGDLAFAVVVYGGGIGGTVAAPLAAKLLIAVGP